MSAITSTIENRRFMWTRETHVSTQPIANYESPIIRSSDKKSIGDQIRLWRWALTCDCLGCTTFPVVVDGNEYSSGLVIAITEFSISGVRGVVVQMPGVSPAELTPSTTPSIGGPFMVLPFKLYIISFSLILHFCFSFFLFVCYLFHDINHSLFLFDYYYY